MKKYKCYFSDLNNKAENHKLSLDDLSNYIKEGKKLEKITNEENNNIPFGYNVIDTNNILPTAANINKTENMSFNIDTNSKQIKLTLFDNSGKILSEDIINYNTKEREYIEYSKKNGKPRAKLHRDTEGNYKLNGEPIVVPEEYRDDFEKAIDNNIIRHKKKFPLGEEYSEIEEAFRNLGIVTNKNDIDSFFSSINYIYKDKDNNILTGEEAFNKIILDEAAKRGLKEKIKIMEDLDNIERSLAEELYKKVEERARLIKKDIIKDFEKIKILEEPEGESKYENKSQIKATINNNGKQEEITFNLKQAKLFDEKDKVSVRLDEDTSELFLQKNNIQLEPGKKHYFVLSEDRSIYVFNDQIGEHHSNFPWIKGNRVFAAGCFILDEDGKIAKIVNDSGHYKPTEKDCTESLLRVLSKMVKKQNQNKGVECLISDSKKVADGYNISVDVSKMGGVAERDNITLESNESQATSVVSFRKIKLFDNNAYKVVSLS